MSLGVILTIDNVRYPDVWTPYRALLDNPLFTALRKPGRFQLLVIFSQSILVAFGVYRLYQLKSGERYFRWFIVGITVLMLFETSVFPIASRTAERTDAYDYIAEQEPGAVITMPFGRQEAKFAMYNQMYHRRPITQGKIARTPEEAYDYINQNLLLRDMTQITDILKASDELIENWEQEIDELLDLGFRYVVVHRLVNLGRHLFVVYTYQERMFFMEIEPEFETEAEAVYDLRKLRDNPPQGDPFEED